LTTVHEAVHDDEYVGGTGPSSLWLLELKLVVIPVVRSKYIVCDDI